MNEFTDEQLERLWKFLGMSDFEFYDKFVADALLEVQTEFMNEFPEFLSGDEAKADIGLDNDEIYQGIMRQIG